MIFELNEYQLSIMKDKFNSIVLKIISVIKFHCLRFFYFIKLFRYLAIIYPLQRYWWRGSHTTCIISIIWILSMMTASPLLYYARAVPFNYSGLDLYDCREEWEGEISSRIYTVILFIITFIIPFISLTFLYGSIGIKTFKNIQPGESLTAMERVQYRKKIKVFLFIYVFSIKFDNNNSNNLQFCRVNYLNINYESFPLHEA